MQSVFLVLLSRTVALIFAICCVTKLHGQLKWDGEAGDGLWQTALNWVGDRTPGIADNVLLDHSLIAINYTVTLPSGNSVVTVRSLTIAPAVLKVIEVVLPAGNTGVPGFVANGGMYGLEIHDGGVFRNSSGASSGTAMAVGDSIKIYNGGRYVHNTARAHATNVMVLSRAPGTEHGIWEFDVPGGAGYTISIAGRVYGDMVLSSQAAGGAKSYTSTGMTTVHVNGNMQFNPGVNYSLNFNAPFVVHGDFLHNGNVFDISGALNNNSLVLMGDMISNGTITETGSGFPVIEWAGSNQNVNNRGRISESITCRIKALTGIVLLAPFSIQHKLELVSGKVKTSPVNILIIQNDAVCTGGSITSFVEGPVRKVGDEDFEFPTGRQGDYAPVKISGSGSATDEFEAEYLYGNPTTIFGSGKEDPPIVRISSLEYWKLERISGTNPRQVTLSVRTYSNATLLEKLVVSRWDVPAAIWKSEGNTSYTGVSIGTITSASVQSFGIFTLGSTVVDQNPLPTLQFDFDAVPENEQVMVDVSIHPGLDIETMEIFRASDSSHFTRIMIDSSSQRKKRYRFIDRVSKPGYYIYKVRVKTRTGDIQSSKMRTVLVRPHLKSLTISSATVMGDICWLNVETTGDKNVQLKILNAGGQLLNSASAWIRKGSNRLSIPFSRLPAGIYYVVVETNDRMLNVKRLIKAY